MPDQPAAAGFHVEDHPDPRDIDVLETQIRREASAAMGLGDEADLAIFVRDAGTVVCLPAGRILADSCHAMRADVQRAVSLEGRRALVWPAVGLCGVAWVGRGPGLPGPGTAPSPVPADVFLSQAKEAAGTGG